MDRCVTLLLKRACPQPGRAPSRVYILLKRACSLPGRATSGVLPHWRTYKCAFSYRFPPAGHHAVRLHTSECVQGKYAFWRRLPPRGISTLTYPHVQGKYAKARPSAVLSTRVRTNARRNAHAFSYRFPPAEHHAVGLHTSTCDPGAHKYAKARYGAVYPRRTSRGRLTYRSMCRT